VADGSFVLGNSDAELLGKAFQVSDPEALSGLIQNIPENSELPVIEYKYDVSPAPKRSREYVYCAHCKKPTHWKGYVVSLGENRRALIGHCCGKKQFGFDFGKVENTFNRESERQRNLRRILPSYPRLVATRAIIIELQSERIFHKLDELRAEARLNWHDFEASLLKSISSENFLVAETNEIDYPQFEREKASIIRYYDRLLSGRMPVSERQRLKNEQSRQLKSLKPKYRTSIHQVGIVYGLGFVRAKTANADQLEGLRHQIWNLCEELNTSPSDKLSDTRLKSIWRQIKRISDDLVRLCDLAQQANVFFDPENLARIEAWSKLTLPEMKVVHSGNSISSNPSGVSSIVLRHTQDENVMAKLRAVAELAHSLRGKSA